MKPKIINEKSKFVVVTYWWGRGNLNKNTQRPCPEDMTKDGKITKKPITYEAMIRRFEKSCIRHGCNHMAVEYPEFAQKGGYQKAINFKPIFIKQALEVCAPRSVLYIDGDMLIEKYPHIFDIPNVDYMARGWNSDPRSSGEWKKEYKKTGFCYDPWIFETSGGTQFFGQTFQAHELLNQWVQEIKKYQGKADDRLISLLFNNSKQLLKTSIIQLPVEYLWLSLDYDDALDVKKRVVISHPECLTGEDRASAEGADSNRIPPRYDYLISDKVQCGFRKFYLYEYVLFPNKVMRNQMLTYLEWAQQFHLLKVVPYDEKYGKRNKVAESNEKMMKSIKIKDMDTVVVTTDKNFFIQKDFVHVVLKKEVIPTILKYIKNGSKVVFAPVGVKKVNLDNIFDKSDKSSVDFMARNINKTQDYYKKEFYLELDQDYPMCFKPHSDILQHLLLMSNNFNALEKLFNESYGFISRMRIKWI